MLFSIPFSDRCLIDFQTFLTLKMLIFHCRGAHFHEIVVSRTLYKNYQFWIQKASKIQSKIYQKSYQKSYRNFNRFLIAFLSKMPPRMEEIAIQMPPLFFTQFWQQIFSIFMKFSMIFTSKFLIENHCFLFSFQFENGFENHVFLSCCKKSETLKNHRKHCYLHMKLLSRSSQ